jgi:precorrin-6Y C5,15-methyltransferase (decarboxylating)
MLAAGDPGGWQPPMVILVGMGLGREDLSVRTLRWLERAQVLVGSSRLLQEFGPHPAEKRPFHGSMDGVLDEIDTLSRVRRTAVIASGDPLFFGIGRRLGATLGVHRVVVFPNVTTLQALCARLVEPWEEVCALTLHGRQGSNWLREVRRGRRVSLLTDPQRSPAWVAGQLRGAGMSDRRMVVGEDLGLPSERIRTLTVAAAEQGAFSALNLVLVLPPAGAAGTLERAGESPPWPLLGLQDELFVHRQGLITKREVRAVVLADLGLGDDQVLWDIGAGSGSVAIEAARLARLQRVFAVERHSARHEDLRANIERFQCGEIEAILGAAPEALVALPDPDRVFIGGSGGELEAILHTVVERLRPGGRVVQTAATLESVERARRFWGERPFAVTISQVQVNRGVPLAGALRLEALNPVFILCARQT